MNCSDIEWFKMIADEIFFFDITWINFQTQ